MNNVNTNFNFQERIIQDRKKILNLISTAFLYLKNDLEKGIESYKRELDLRLNLLKEGENIVNDAIDNRINKMDYNIRMKEFWIKIDKKLIREEEKIGDKNNLIISLAKIGNYSFVIGLILLIIGAIIKIILLLLK